MFNIQFSEETGLLVFEPWHPGKAHISPDIIDDMLRECLAAKAKREVWEIMQEPFTVNFQEFVTRWVKAKIAEMEGLDSNGPFVGGEGKKLSEIKRGDPGYNTWHKGFFDGVMGLENFNQAVAHAKPEDFLPEELRERH